MIQVRKAKVNDIDKIVDFQLKMALETENLKLNLTTVYQGVEAVLNNESLGAYYIAEYEKFVVGCLLTTYEWSDWRNGTVIWLQSVYVIPEYREKSVFKALYFSIKNEVERNDKLKGIRLFVDKTNVKAQKVYQALGMNGEHYKTYEWLK